MVSFSSEIRISAFTKTQGDNLLFRKNPYIHQYIHKHCITSFLTLMLYRKMCKKIFNKRVVDFSATLMYNLIRKAIGYDSDSPSVKFKFQKEMASKLC